MTVNTALVEWESNHLLPTKRIGVKFFPYTVGQKAQSCKVLSSLSTHWWNAAMGVQGTQHLTGGAHHLAGSSHMSASSVGGRLCISLLLWSENGAMVQPIHGCYSNHWNRAASLMYFIWVHWRYHDHFIVIPVLLTMSCPKIPIHGDLCTAGMGPAPLHERGVAFSCGPTLQPLTHRPDTYP